MKIALIDLPDLRQNLLPLTFTRPIADIRIGILKISEKWEHLLNSSASYITESYLEQKFKAEQKPNFIINGSICPDKFLSEEILKLKTGEALFKDDVFIAASTEKNLRYGEDLRKIFTIRPYQASINQVIHSWDIFSKNGQQIEADFDLLTKGRKSCDISDPHTIVYKKENIFIEEGTELKACIINAEAGPVYIGKNTKVHEGAIIRGPFALGEGAHVNPGAKIKRNTTIGPYCKVGGEVSNAVFLGYCNKGHDGYLGNAVIGEWCNLGADTNNSNLKNNYTSVKMWDYGTARFKDTGLQFCGLVMGDHAKCAINTMFNTGTVVGVAANVFGAGFPRNFLPSFSWGGINKTSTFGYKRALETAEAMMSRRSIELTEVDKDILNYVFEKTAKYRTWDNKEEV